jgi:hypothetical protein
VARKLIDPRVRRAGKINLAAISDSLVAPK